MIFDLKFLLEDIKVKYRNLEKNTGNNVNDEEVDEVKNVITMFTDQVENAIPIVIKLKYIINSKALLTGCLNLTIDNAPIIPSDNAMLPAIVFVIT